MESGKKLLPQQIATLRKQNRETQQHYDELEQYSRRVCLGADSVPKQNNEKVEDVLKFFKGQIEEVPDFEIPEAVIDRELFLIIPTKKRRNCVSLLLFSLRPSVIVHYFSYFTHYFFVLFSIGSKSKARLDLAKP